MYFIYDILYKYLFGDKSDKTILCINSFYKTHRLFNYVVEKAEVIEDDDDYDDEMKFERYLRDNH